MLGAISEVFDGSLLSTIASVAFPAKGFPSREKSSAQAGITDKPALA